MSTLTHFHNADFTRDMCITFFVSLPHSCSLRGSETEHLPWWCRVLRGLGAVTGGCWPCARQSSGAHRRASRARRGPGMALSPTSSCPASAAARREREPDTQPAGWRTPRGPGAGGLASVVPRTRQERRGLAGRVDLTTWEGEPHTWLTGWSTSRKPWMGEWILVVVTTQN